MEHSYIQFQKNLSNYRLFVYSLKIKIEYAIVQNPGRPLMTRCDFLKLHSSYRKYLTMNIRHTRTHHHTPRHIHHTHSPQLHLDRLHYDRPLNQKGPLSPGYLYRLFLKWCCKCYSSCFFLILIILFANFF